MTDTVTAGSPIPASIRTRLTRCCERFAGDLESSTASDAIKSLIHVLNGPRVQLTPAIKCKLGYVSALTVDWNSRLNGLTIDELVRDADLICALRWLHAAAEAYVIIPEPPRRSWFSRLFGRPNA